MRKLHLTLAIWLVATAVLCGQELPKADKQDPKPPSTSSQEKDGTAKASGPIDVLTDTNGFNLRPYFNEKLLPEIKQSWYSRIPQAARPPMMKKGRVSLVFRLARDGKVSDIRLVESSGDVSLDRAAFGGVASASPLPPLPSDYQCRDLTLRFTFYYNPGKDVEKKKDPYGNSLIPCVTTRIQTGDDVAVLVSPEAAAVIIGRAQQFSAALTGSTSAAVRWSLQGAGCEGSACGTISADGLYTAPANLPHPATVTVNARSELLPDSAGSATITLLSPTPN